MGELGEAANILKKVRRGDMSLEEARPLLAAELADTATYLDILAMQVGVELGEAVKDKFNLVSERVGANVRIGDDDDWHQRWNTGPGARCPQCNSPDPSRHPAMQFEGEVQPCTHPFHRMS